MDSQLYVWARRQEIERELTREALLSEAKDLATEEGAAEKHPEPARIRQRVRGLSNGALSALGLQPRSA